MDFDLILAGGGLTNGLIALRLAATRPELRVAIVEAGATFGGNHSWSSFEDDITPAQVAWTAPLMAHRWPRYSIRFPAHARTLVAGYRTTTSERLAAAVAAAVPPERLLFGTPVAAITPTSVTLADQRVLTARAVIDGRGHAPGGALDLRSQKFLGLEVELTADHGLDGPIIMDATVPQLDGYRFVYTLPFGARVLLVEDTYYSDGADLAPDQLRARIHAYIAEQGWSVARVIREEVGVLPIALDGNIKAFWNAGEAGVPLVGLRAALFNPITGYSFPDAVRTAELVAGLEHLDPHNLVCSAATTQRGDVGRAQVLQVPQPDVVRCGRAGGALPGVAALLPARRGAGAALLCGAIDDLGQAADDGGQAAAAARARARRAVEIMRAR